MDSRRALPAWQTTPVPDSPHPDRDERYDLQWHGDVAIDPRIADLLNRPFFAVEVEPDHPPHVVEVEAEEQAVEVYGPWRRNLHHVFARMLHPFFLSHACNSSQPAEVPRSGASAVSRKYMS